MGASRWLHIFKAVQPAIVGMIHVKALPGTPNYTISMTDLISQCCKEAGIYKNAGVNAILIENMHDIPYVLHPNIGAEIVASMSVISAAVRRAVPDMPCGIQVLAAGNVEALAIAHAVGCQFIRAEGFVFGHMADEGLVNACAGPLLRYRKSIGADDIMIICDVKKKHSSHAITSDVSLVETAKAAEFFLSDGVIVTGTSTGDAPDKEDATSVLNAVSLPVLVGSGVTIDNVHQYMKCHGMIVGSYFKVDGRWPNDIDADKVKKFMSHVLELRNEMHTS